MNQIIAFFIVLPVIIGLYAYWAQEVLPELIEAMDARSGL